MRHASFVFAGAVAAVVLIAGVTAAGPGNGARWGRSDAPSSQLEPGRARAGTLTVSETERRELRRMREEEKLARDVYRTLGEKWGLAPFLHIQRSEEQHLALMGELIERTRTSDPVTHDATGVFQSSEMRQLYASLIQMGTDSPVDALRAGARVEELDISDLEKAIANTQSPDVRRTYEGLLRASRNHLRAFAGNLEARGAGYVPRHLPPDRYAAIVAGSHEPCGLCGGGAPGDGGCGMAQCANRRTGGPGCGVSALGQGTGAGPGCGMKCGSAAGKRAASTGRCGGGGCGGGRHGVGASGD